MTEGHGTSSCMVTRNVENYVILALDISNYEKGLSLHKELNVVPEGFARLPDNPCGLNLSWSFDNGTLTLTGTGDMFDYPDQGAPWCSFARSITSIQLPEGMTSIGKMAFEFVAISEISIPDTVERIDSEAFLECMSLQTVHIPKNVRSISSTAFYCTPSLTDFSVDEENPYYCSKNHMILSKDGKEMVVIPEGRSDLVIPDGVTTLTYFVSFTECHATSVTIPESVTKIDGAYMFSDYMSWAYGYLKDIYYQGTRKQLSEVALVNTWGEDPAVLPMWDKITLHYLPTPEEKTVTLPANILYIEDNAFAGIDAEEVIIPDGAVSIGANAFANNDSLVIVRIPASVTEIADNAFSGNNPYLIIVAESGSVAEIYAGEHGLQ